MPEVGANDQMPETERNRNPFYLFSSLHNTGGKLVLCIIAFFVFAFMSIFSVRYRPLAKDAFKCVFLMATLRPCESGLDQKIKAKVVSQVFDRSPPVAQFINKHFELLSWIFVILSFASMVILAQGVYNIYLYGTCDPVHPEQCLVTGIIGQPICPNSYDGINVGPADAKVQIIEFGCFTCPYTKASEDAVRDILLNYDGKVRYVYKTYPITTHSNAYEAASASICANNQGKYWEYRAALFANQSTVVIEGKPYLITLANETGLDTGLFTSCIDSNTTMAQVKLMQEEGYKSNIHGTPTFFVNRRYVANAADLEKIVLEELGK